MGGAGVSTTGFATVPQIGPTMSGPAHPGSSFRGSGTPAASPSYIRRFRAVFPFTESHVLVPSHPAATSYHLSTSMSFAPSTDTRGSGPLPRFTKKLNFTDSLPPSTRSQNEPGAFGCPFWRSDICPFSDGCAANFTRHDIFNPGRRSERGSSGSARVAPFSSYSTPAAATAVNAAKKNIFAFICQSSL